MNDNYQKIVTDIYKTMNDNLDIINIWFKNDNQKLDKRKLFTYIPTPYTSELGQEKSIYEFINKLVANILSGKSFKLKKLNYLEDNFLELFNIVIKEYKNNE